MVKGVNSTIIFSFLKTTRVKNMEEIRWCHCGDEIEDPNATECEFCSSLKIELEEYPQLYYKTSVN